MAPDVRTAPLRHRVSAAQSRIPAKVTDSSDSSACNGFGADAAAAIVRGAFVVVVCVEDGKYRRRVYLNLPAAERAARRASVRGRAAEVVLCRLVPVGGVL